MKSHTVPSVFKVSTGSALFLGATLLGAAWLFGCSSSQVDSGELKKSFKSKDLIYCQANSQVKGSEISEGLKVKQVGEKEFEVIYQYMVESQDQMIDGAQEITGKTVDYYDYAPTIQPGVILIDLKNPTFKRKHGASSESKKLDPVRIQLVGKKLSIVTLKDYTFKKDTIIELSNCQSLVK